MTPVGRSLKPRLDNADALLDPVERLHMATSSTEHRLEQEAARKAGTRWPFGASPPSKQCGVPMEPFPRFRLCVGWLF